MILGSWLPPTLAIMIFVVSFESGRRKHQKAIAASLGGSEDINYGGGGINKPITMSFLDMEVMEPLCMRECWKDEKSL
jgi:hypothetical protein